MKCARAPKARAIADMDEATLARSCVAEVTGGAGLKLADPRLHLPCRARICRGRPHPAHHALSRMLRISA